MQHNFNKEYVAGFASLPEFIAAYKVVDANHGYDDAYMQDVYVNCGGTMPTEPAKTKTKKLNTDEGQE